MGAQLFSINDEAGCNLQHADLKELPKCHQYPERAFSLWAMRNLVKFLDTWENLFFKSALTSSLWNADIARKFLWHAPETDLANPGAWLTIVAGMFTSVGSFVPGLGAIASNGLAGVGTVAAGAAG
ncbi:hypothetical protein IMZ48_17185, partial [Candidatus Bathyarchaeota archaeon]|nr:hypothetical protein [Candidatus Bathyarchaeota archaeon]